MARKINPIFYFIATGILLGLSFPPLPFNLFAFIAFIPIFFANDNFIIKKKFLQYYITFFIYHGITNWWISSWQPNSDTYLLISGLVVWLVHPVFFTIPLLIYDYIKKIIGKEKAVWLFPIIWVAYEWCRTLTDIAYPWLTIGYTQAYNIYWNQFADIAGIWGISFVILLANVVIYRIITIANENKINSLNFQLMSNKKIRFLLLFLFIMITIPIVYSLERINKFNHEKLLSTNPTITVGLVQANINPWDKWSGIVFDQIAIHQRLQDSLISSFGVIDLSIWSETAVHYVSLDFNSNHNFGYFEEWVNNTGISLLTGFADLYILKPDEKITPTAKYLNWDSSKAYDTFNSVLLLNPHPYNKKNPQIYHKIKLTPFGEAIPFIEFLSFLRPFLEWNVGISSWRRGDSIFNLTIQNQNVNTEIGTVICIESVYPDFVRQFTRKGAEILSVITNDGWYDHTFGPEQHYIIASMRAIENRRYLLRCANTGKSGFISPTGISISVLPQYESLASAEKVALIDYISFYVLFGDWLPYYCVAFIVIHISFLIFSKKFK